ncbi:hypothetical protein BKA66DRAFT_503092 [Pyrenochaeta sp. MPI-SDFR-AT-0127]|nr:hypothetical protein BKA66DRAFT_503092 [Pyrenochaeta sp. MPI-SDFR-AT-0127]
MEEDISSSSKKSKKKKGKKGKSTEIEPSTLVSEGQRDLDLPSDAVQAEPGPEVVLPTEEQPLQDSSLAETPAEPVQAEASFENHAPVDEQPQQEASLAEPSVDVASLTQIDLADGPSQPATPMEEEADTSKKAKKRKGKKGKSVDIDPSATDVPEAALEPEGPQKSAIQESAKIEPVDATSPAVSSDVLQEAALVPIEVEPDVSIAPTLPVESLPEASKPSTPVEDISTEPTVVERAIEEAAAPENETQNRETTDAIIEEEPAAISKKSKKKKGKKGKSTDITEPSTPISEEPTIQFSVPTEPAHIEKSVDDATLPVLDEPRAKEESEVVADLPSPVDTSQAEAKVEEKVEDAQVSTHHEPAQEIITPPIEQAAEDASASAPQEPVHDITTSSASIEPAADDDGAEPSSQKAKKKKKKGKKGKQDDTEPSTPVTEEQVSHVDPTSEPAHVEKSIDHATQPLQEDLDASINLQPSLESSLAESGPVESTLLVQDELDRDMTTSIEPAIEHDVEPTSKTAKKKKGKKGKASQDNVTEQIPDVTQPVPVVDSPSEEKPLEDVALPAEPLQSEIPTESTAFEDKAALEPSEELPLERELALEMGQLAEPISFEVPIEGATFDDQTLPEPPQPETPQVEQPTEVEDATSTSKKAKKKKGKKSKSISEPQTPVTESEPLFPDGTAKDEPEVSIVDASAAATPLPETRVVSEADALQATPSDAAEPDAATLTTDLVKDKILETPLEPEPMTLTENEEAPPPQVEEPATEIEQKQDVDEDTATSKKNKKKGKKGKRASVSESSTPLDTPTIELKDAPLDDPSISNPAMPTELKDRSVDVPVEEQPLPTLPATEELPTEPAEADEGASLSKKDKKKAKKDKRVSIVEDITSIPPATTEDKEIEPDVQPSSIPSVVEQQPIPDSVVTEEPASISPIANDLSLGAAPEEDTAPLTKKDKKKAKKAKRGSIADDTSSIPATPTEEKEVLLENQPILATVPTEESIIPASTVTTEEPSSVSPIVNNLSQDTIPEEETPVLSKKDKKKAKKSKRGSIAESEPSTPSETPIEEKESPLDAQQPPLTTAEEQQPDVGPAEELTSTPPVSEELAKESIQEEDFAPVAKKDKKKAKKAAKRASIAEAEPSAPVTLVDESDRQLVENSNIVPVNAEQVEVPIVPFEDQATPGPVSVEEPPKDLIEEELSAPTSKKDKKKAKKSAKLGSISETEPTTSVEQQTEEAENISIEDAQIATPLILDEKAVVAPFGDQPAFAVTATAKSQAADVIPVSEESQPLETEQSTPNEEITPVPPVIDDQDVGQDKPEAGAVLSKSQKKKAKKSKRASVAESEPSQPATPSEEVVKELVQQEQPSVPQLIEEPTSGEQPGDAQVTSPHLLDELTSEPKPIEEDDTPASTSKKDKKKAKKQSNKSVPFLAHETPEEAKVSDTQPSPSHPIPSETPIPFSGIPTSYPLPVIASEFVDFTSADVQPERARESVEEVEEVKEAGERALSVEKEVGEPTVDNGDSAVAKKEKKSKKGKKRGSVVEEPSADTSTTTIEVDQPIVESPALMQSEPIPETEHSRLPDNLQEQLLTNLDATDVQSFEVQHIEKTMTAIEEPETATLPQPENADEDERDMSVSAKKKTKGKKDKRASTLEESVQETGIPEPIGDVPLDNKLDDVVPTAKPVDDISAPLDSTKRVEDLSQSRDVMIQQSSIESPSVDIVEAFPSVKLKPAFGLTKRVAPTSTAPQQVADPSPDQWRSLLSNKNKKGRKGKLPADNDSSFEANPGVQPIQSKDLGSIQVDKVAQEPLVAQEGLVEDTPPEQSHIVQPITETVEEPQQPVGDDLGTPLSTKEKAEKTNTSSETATPVEEGVPKLQQDIIDETITLQGEPTVTERITEPEQVIMDPLPVQQDDDLSLEKNILLPQQEGVQSLPEAIVEPSAPTEQDLGFSSSKKDKKKGRKGKKSGTATPIQEVVPEIQQVDQEPMIVPDAEIKNEVDKAATLESSLDAQAINIVETVPTSIPATEPEMPLEEDFSTPTSKKDKKKAKKAKAKDSGTATPTTEEALVLQSEKTQELASAQPTSEQIGVEDDPVSTLQEKAVAEETHEVSHFDATSIPVAEHEPSVDEWASPSLSRKKSKKKGKKSGAATPINEDIPEILPEIAQEPVAVPVKSGAEILPTDDSLAVPQEDTLVNETRELEPVDAKDMPAAELEPASDEWNSPSASTKKNKKKGKRSGLATPVAVDIPPSEAVKVVMAEDSEKSITLGKNPTDASPEELPAQERRVEQVEPTMTSKAIPEPGPSFDEWALPSASQKKSKKKGKKSGTATPITNDDLPVIETETTNAQPEEQEPSLATVPNLLEEIAEEKPNEAEDALLPTPIEEAEMPVDDWALSAPKAKGMKKGKKVEAATPVIDDKAIADVDSFVTPLETPEAVTAELPASTQALVEEKLQNEDAPPPSTPAVGAQPEIDEWALPTSKKKGKKNKGKRSESQTPVAELADPIAIETPEDSHDRPVIEPESSKSAPMPTQAEEPAPLQEVSESVDDEKPTLNRKLSKKDRKKAQKQAEAVSFDNDPIGERTRGIEQETVQVIPAPEPTEPDQVRDVQETVHVGQEPPQAVEPKLELPQATLDELLPMTEDGAVTLVDERPREVAAEDEWATTSKKAKKAKKEKKGKRQSVSLDVPETIEGPSLEVIEQPPDVNEAQTEHVVTELAPSSDLRTNFRDEFESPPSEIRQAQDLSLPLSGEVHPSYEQSLDQHGKTERSEAAISPESLPITDVEVPLVVEADDAPTSVTRKTSNKGKKGKKEKNVTDLSSELKYPSEQIEAPIAAEIVGSRLIPDPTFTPPVVEGAIEAAGQPLDIEQASEPSTSQTTKTTVDLQALQEPQVTRELQDTAKDEAEDEWGIAPKKSKKDKKKAKKSKSTSGDATPAELSVGPAVLIEEHVAANDQVEHAEVQADDVQSETPQETVIASILDEQPQLTTQLTAAPDTVAQDTSVVTELLQDSERQPTEVDDSVLSVSQSVSKKSKKKKGKKGQMHVDEATSEPSTPVTPINETPKAIPQELPIDKHDDLPIITETKIEVERSASPTQDVAEHSLQPEQGHVVPVDVFPQEPPRDTATQPLEQETQEIEIPAGQLSPPFKAVQDEVADLRLRSEALDNAFTAHENLGELSTIEPPSMFDVVSKLSKKDKKKAKKGKGSTHDSEPTTPAAEPEVAVETKEIVENPVVEEEPVKFDLPSRKLSKKEKKKAEQSTMNVDELSETQAEMNAPAGELQEPVMEQPPEDFSLPVEPLTSEAFQALQSRDVKSTGVNQSASTELEAPTTLVTGSQELAEELPVPSRKLSKKDKKKSKQSATVDDSFFQPEIAFDATPTEGREYAESDPKSTLPDATPATEEILPTIVPDTQDTTLEERPSLSRKLSKKDKKKQAKAASFAQDDTFSEGVEEVVLTPMVEEALRSHVLPQISEQQDVLTTESPPLTRKLSKKDKKKAKQANLPWDEPEEPLMDVERLPNIQESVKETVSEVPVVQHEVHVNNSLLDRSIEPMVANAAMVDTPYQLKPSRTEKEDVSMEYTEGAPEEQHTPLLGMRHGNVPTPDDPDTHSTSMSAPEPGSATASQSFTEPDVTTSDFLPRTKQIEPPPAIDEHDNTGDVQSVPVITEAIIAPALTRKQSKKDKKKGKKKETIEEFTEPEKTEEVEIAEAVQSAEHPTQSYHSTDALPPAVIASEVEGTKEVSLPIVSEHTEQNVLFDAGPHALEAATRAMDERVVVDTPADGTDPDVEAQPEMEYNLTLPPQNTIAEKREYKVSPKTLTEPNLDEVVSTTRDVIQDPTDARMVISKLEPEASISSKKSKKEKRKSKKTDAPFDESPTMSFEPDTLKEQAVEASRGRHGARVPSDQIGEHVVRDMSKTPDDLSATIPQTSIKALEEPQPPALIKKTSQKHRLAALFEHGAPQDDLTSERGLRKEGTGSVKNLAEQYENQSRSVTPILLPTSEARIASRAASGNRLPSKSPEDDYGFAATVAASLQESGFDPGYAVNDPSFHRSTSAHQNRDIAPDDEVATAKERANTSRLGNLSRSSSFSSSPKMQPAKHAKPDVLPPIEVAMASTDAVSFDPLDVLNDPAFSRRKTPPGVLEAADPEELWSSTKAKNAKGKKKRASLPNTSTEIDMPARKPTIIEEKPMDEPEESFENKIVMNPSDSQRAAPFETSQGPDKTEEYDSWPATTTKTSKKAKKDKKRASLVENSVEYAAAKTPAIETHADVPLAVETSADSTVREVELDTALPSSSVPLTIFDQEEGLVRNAQQKRTTDDFWDEMPKRGKKLKKEKTSSVIKEDKKVARKLAVDDIPISSATVDQESTALIEGEGGEYPFPHVVGSEETTRQLTEKTRGDKAEMDKWASPSQKKGKKSRKGIAEVETELGPGKPKEIHDGDENLKRGLPSESETKDVVKDKAIHVTQPAAYEPHKRRTHPVSSDEEQPQGKRLHTVEVYPTTPAVAHKPASLPQISAAAERSEFDVTPSHPIINAPEEPSNTTRGLTPVIEPTWSFAGVRDSAVHVADSPTQAAAPQFQESTRDSGYHDSAYSPTIPQGYSESAEKLIREKKRQSKEPKTPLNEPTRALEGHRDVEESPSLPEYPTFAGVTTPSGTDYATKERTSYLFDSSPSTRAYGTSPIVAPKTPARDSPKVAHTPIRDNSESSRKLKKSQTGSQHDQTSPTREVKQKEPYQSLFGDPSEKKSGKSAALATPTPKHAHTPSNQQLDTIKESSPDDSPLHKKGRSITDVGAPERGVKSARHTGSQKSFSERLKSPPPVTPTASSRKVVPPVLDTSGGRITPSKDSPWHQVHESVDRSMTLSPARRLPRSSPSADPIKQHMAEQRSPSVRSERSMSNIAKLRSPDQERPLSSASNRSTHSLRRVDRSASGDLRSASRLGDVSAQDAKNAQPNLSGIALAAGATAAIAGIAAASKYDPVRGEGKGRRASMAETYEAWGEAQGSPMSPTRPPSVRKRQSMQILDLQSQLDQLAAQNHSLEDAKSKAEEILQAAQHQRQVDEQLVAEAVEARDREIHQRDIDIAQLKDTLQRLQEEITRLTELNNTLTEANRNLTNDTNERYAHLQSEGQLVHQQWETSQRELEALRTKHNQMTRGMEEAIRGEIGIVLDDRKAEIDRLNKELVSAREQVKALQKQILASKKPSESFLTIRDEDYFDSACQQLCQHVQQWVLRFSKFSDTRACRLSSEISADTRLDTSTRQKIDTRLDNAILDGSDVDSLLADRVKRRDVFMSVVMTMIWEYVFTRYLFGMDREQRQKLKSLEKTLSEVGPPRAVAQWRAITLTLLSRREPFMQQRAQDTEAVVHEIYSTLSTLLSPPSHLQRQIQESLRNVMRLAVELSIEMRTQRAEYIMLPPLQPEYDTNGDLVAKVTFNASLMNERSGETTSNDELEARGAIVKIVLFPLVVKKGDDFGEGEDEIVVCPAQVLVARPQNKKVVRMMSGAMEIDRPNSRASRMTSIAPESSVMDLSGAGSNVI